MLHLRGLVAVIGLVTFGALSAPATAGATPVATGSSVASASSEWSFTVTAPSSGELGTQPSRSIKSQEYGADILSTPAISPPNSTSRSLGLDLTGANAMALFVGSLAMVSLGFLVLTFIRRRVKLD
jgi:hypothetical protein